MTQLAEPWSAEPSDRGTTPALAALLTGTFVGTVSNNVLNVPLSQILLDFDAELDQGILVVAGFLLTFAAVMPLAGYVGDRFGRRRVYCAALLATAVCSLGAATAPNLEILVMWRCLGGVSAAPFAPAVMGLIAWLFGPARRARAVGAWASVNGIGQAVGPSMGGVIADSWGWRWVFVPLIPLALIGFGATMRWIPRYPATVMKLDVAGASTLTVGAALLVLAITVSPQEQIPTAALVVMFVAAVTLLSIFVVHCLRSSTPFVDLRAVCETRFARSAVASFAQMFCLSVSLLVVPLYLVAHGTSAGTAGLVLFTLPLVMAVLAPLVGRASDRFGARPVLRIGLVVLAAGLAILALVLGVSDTPTVAVIGALVIVGVGVALVQTPAAAGSTRSRAGAAGTGLGLFNLIRFGGAAVGAAWVGIAVGSVGFPVVLAVPVGAALVALVAAYLGRNPELYEQH